MEPRGVYPILPTPVDDNGDVDERSLRRLIDFQLETGVLSAALIARMANEIDGLQAIKLEEPPVLPNLSLILELAPGYHAETLAV